jgi:hypothetical protein
MNETNIEQEVKSVDQLALTRGALLQHIAAGQIAPDYLQQQANRYQGVTEWEELLLAAMDPEAGWLRAFVAIHRPVGYSGLFRQHGSIEYVRFFIDWQDGTGYRPVSLAHFKVCDQADEVDDKGQPRIKRLSVPFDAGRYWGCVLDGLRPKVKAVLSWHRVPELDAGYVPIFGNVVESRICAENEDSLSELVPFLCPAVTGDKARFRTDKHCH